MAISQARELQDNQQPKVLSDWIKSITVNPEVLKEPTTDNTYHMQYDSNPLVILKLVEQRRLWHFRPIPNPNYDVYLERTNRARVQQRGAIEMPAFTSPRWSLSLNHSNWPHDLPQTTNLNIGHVDSQDVSMDTLFPRTDTKPGDGQHTLDNFLDLLRSISDVVTTDHADSKVD
jgi:hypothetical protein